MIGFDRLTKTSIIPSKMVRLTSNHIVNVCLFFGRKKTEFPCIFSTFLMKIACNVIILLSINSHKLNVDYAWLRKKQKQSSSRAIYSRIVCAKLLHLRTLAYRCMMHDDQWQSLREDRIKFLLDNVFIPPSRHGRALSSTSSSYLAWCDKLFFITPKPHRRLSPSTLAIVPDDK